MMQDDWQNIKIMLIDDEPEVASSVAKILQTKGFNEDNLISIQNDFENRIFQEIDDVDLILMDLQLTKGINDGGLELVRKIRHEKIKIPIIVLTNLSTNQAMSQSLEADADMFVTKSSMLEELLPRIDFIYQRRIRWLYLYNDSTGKYKNLRYFNSKFSLNGSFMVLFLITIKNKNVYIKYLSLDQYYENILKITAESMESRIDSVVKSFEDSNIKNYETIIHSDDKILISIIFDGSNNKETLKKISDVSIKLKNEFSVPIRQNYNFNSEEINHALMNIEVKVQCNLCQNVDKDACLRGVSSNRHDHRHCCENNDFKKEKESLETYAKALYSSNQTTEIIPYFQPIRDKNNEIIKYEVLARVKKDNGKVESIYPYLDAVKVTGTSYELTSQIIQKACEIFYRSDAFKDEKVGLSFNITNNELLEYEKFSRDLESWIPWIGEENDKKAAKSRITFEILERDALSEDILDKIHALDKEGYHIAIDDFGVECSSFDKVSDIARDLIIKIDGKYIKDLRTNKRHQKIVRAIAFAAQELNYLTVAEYVEDETTRQMLLDYGIDLFQGYYQGGEPRPSLSDTPDSPSRRKRLFQLKK